MSILEVLKSELDKSYAAEIYGGSSILSVLSMVDLEAGMDEENKLSIVRFDSSEFYEREVPSVHRLERRGERWLLTLPEQHDFEWISDDIAKVMRARFLLLRDFYFQHFHVMHERMRNDFIASFHPRGLHVPPRGSAMAKMLGMLE